MSIKEYLINRRIFCILLVILFVSFIAKMITGYVIRESFFHRGNSYGSLNAIAQNLVENHEYAIEHGIPSIDYEPLYPFILALSYGIFGVNWFGVTLIQASMYGLTSYLLFLIGKELKSEFAGLLIAIYHSFYPFLFVQSLSVVDTTQYVLVITALIYFSLRYARRHGAFWQYCLVGTLMGLSLLSRGSALVILPPLVVYVLISSDKKAVLPCAVTILMAAIIVLSPWLLRNYYYCKAFIISTHGPFGLWQGNNEHSYNCLKNNISCDEIYRLKPPPPIYQKYPIKARPPMDAVKVAGEYKNAAWYFIRNNPKEFVNLCLIKFIKFWSLTYNPTISSYKYGSEKIRQIVYRISYFPLLLILPFGLYFFWIESRTLFLLFVGILITYTAAHMIVMGYSRLRIPIDTLLMIFLGIVLSNIRSKYIEYRS